MPKAKSFYIIDGHAHIYRAYFAPFRDLNSPVTGEPTKATYVFTQMLLNLIDQRKPDYLAMVIDSGDESVFRKEIYPEYKATRSARPDDFFPQEKRILEIVKDIGVPIFAKPGFEADDLIATMARELCEEDFEVFLVTKDKDLRQTLTPCVHMYDPAVDEVIDEKKMEEKVGYSPREAVEVQTLMGDAIDNIPGIPGVGEKTAAKLIKKYGTAEAVLEHLDELTPKMRENFEKFADRLPIARQLVTLKTDVEFDFDAETCRFTGLNDDALKRHLRECGFTTLLKRLGDDGEAPAPAKPQPPRRVKYQPLEQGLFGPIGGGGAGDGSAQPPAEGDGPQPQTCLDCSYECVDTDENFDIFLDLLRQQKRFAFDTETISLGAMQHPLVGMSFSWKEGTGYYVPIIGPAGCKLVDCERVLRELKPILEDGTIKKVGHNLKYDLLVMRQAGIHVRGVSMDSMIAAFLIDAGRMRYGIDQLALELLNFRKIETTELIGKGRNQITMDRVPMDRISCYAAEDADIALRLCDLFEKKLEELPTLRKLADNVETPLIDVLVEMERNGIAVDPAVLKEQSGVLDQRIEELRAKIIEAAGVEFNPDSPKQLGDVLFNRLKLKVIKKTKTGPSTDVEVLDKLSDVHPVPKLVLEYRSLVKLKNTYLDNLTEYLNPITRRIHGSFNQIGAETGRLSMNDPNLQNIPIRTDEGRRIRLAFVPGDAKNNVLLTADYSQIELRFLAHFTQEPALLKAFREDEDVHRTVASEVFNVPLEAVSRQQRNYAKTINFGIIYGVSAYGLARRIEGLNVQQAAELIAAYHKRFPSIKQFLEKCVMEAQAQGYVETMMGRRRPITEISSNILSMRNAAERMAINSVVQGSAADLIKLAMRKVFDRLARENRPSRMLLQVHDELVFETPAEAAETDAAIIREEMTSAMTLDVPLKVEVGWGKNWQEVK
ncbi:MAG: polymerase [Phycisphaerales bacterium]|jgi:DNA polymerase-1|nr:polymerase [Phycisphaerales bacterium]